MNRVFPMERTVLSILMLGAWMAAGQNTTEFQGEVRLTCMNGTCTFSEDCANLTVPGTLVPDDIVIEYTDITGDVELTPASCQAECSDCMAVPGSDKDEGGCIRSAGYVYCPETDECVRPWESKCPLQGTSFTGPVDIQCESGARCATSSDSCELTIGSYTIGGFYLTQLEGSYTVPDKCDLTCQGCTCDGCTTDGNSTDGGSNSTDTPQESGTVRHNIRFVIGAFMGYFTLVLL